MPLLNPYVPNISDGISLFTACKNRLDNLEEALQTWIQFPEIDEIIIVDWSSDQSLKPLIEKYQNGKITLAVVPGQPKWILSLACNLAARLTSFTRLLKVDADIKILPGFFEKHILKPSIFFTGNWIKRRNENERYLNGSVYLFREDFFKVNGYNEYIKFYGWDDSDLYERLCLSGLKKIDIDNDTLHHIPHSHRTTLQDGFNNIQDIEDDVKSNIEVLMNQYLCRTVAIWTVKNEMLRFRIEIQDDHTLLCIQDQKDNHILPKKYYDESEWWAVKERLKKEGIQFDQSILEEMEREELFDFYYTHLNRDNDIYKKNLYHLIIKLNKLLNDLSNQKGKEIKLLKDSIDDLEGKLLLKDNLLRQKNNLLDQKTIMLNQKNNMISQQKIILEQKNKELLRVYQSYSWRIGRFITRCFGFMLWTRRK
jgi:hypothetical protein